MPYAVRPIHNEFQVYNTDTGRIFAKHALRGQAYGQLGLLNRIRHLDEDFIHMKVGGMALLPKAGGTRPFVMLDGIPIAV